MRRLEDPYVLGALCGAAALVLAFTFPLWGGALVLACPLRELTGIPCPTCYGTRAIVALTAGDARGALRLNPLVTFGALGMVAWLPLALGTALRVWPRPRWNASWLRPLAPLASALVVANWVYLVVFGA